MSNTTSIADYQKSFALMLAGAEANAAALPGTEELRSGLATAAEGVQSALNRQSNLKGQAQQATRDLEDALELGKQMYSRLRNGVHMHFSKEAEKLEEFGLKPRRPPVRANAARAKKKLSGPGPNPAQDAASETDGRT
jgi:hypothetical protein